MPTEMPAETPAELGPGEPEPLGNEFVSGATDALASSGRPARSPIRPRLLAGLSVAYVAIATFPPLSPGPGTGLDGSWVVELNRLSALPPVFGRLVAFTYGPLGYLLYPMHLGSNLLQAAVVRFLFAAAFAALAWRRLRDAPGPFAPAVFALSQVLAAALGLGFEYQLVLLAQLTAVLALETVSLPLMAASGALAAVLVFMKTTAGLGAIAAAGAVLLLWTLGRRRGAGTAIAACAGATAITAGLIAFRWLPSVAELGPWLRNAAAIASPYSEAMSIPGPALELWMAVPALVGFGALAAFLGWRRLPGGTAALASAGPVFLAFKHAFVRQDVHALIFFPVLAASLGLVGSDPALRSRRARVAILACVVAALGGAAVIGAEPREALKGEGAFSGAQVAGTVLGVSGARSLAAWASQEELARNSGPEALKGDHVPWLSEVTAGRTVGVVPWEQALCLAQPLACVANPTLQTYSAYSPELDRRTAEHYSGASAPAFVVLHLGSFDYRFVTFDTPELWRALRRNYTVSPRARGVFVVGGDYAFLLELRRNPRSFALRELGESRVSPGQWVRLPSVDGPVVVRVKLRPNVLHLLKSTLFRVDPVYVSLRDPMGHVQQMRITPATAASGLAVQQLPRDPWQALAFFQESPPLLSVEAIRIEGPGLDCYKDDIGLEWLEELEGPAAESQDR